MDTSLYGTLCCGPNDVLIIEVSLYRTVYCGLSDVLIIEVPLYRTVYCGPIDALIIEVSVCIPFGLHYDLDPPCLYALCMVLCSLVLVCQY